MLVLLGFAVLAGAGTALSPCVLPVLPALLSAGGVGGRRRPLGIVLGLSITFTVTIVGVAKVVDGVGLGSDPLRDRRRSSCCSCSASCCSLPSVAARIEAPLSRLARFGPRSRGDGFCSGLLVGGGARLRLHALRQPDPRGGDLGQRRQRAKRSRSRSPTRSARRSCCSRCTLGGRRLFDRVRAAGRGPLLQRALGAIMILTAVAILTNLDVNFDQFVAQHIPDVNLTASLECSNTVTGRLHEISGHQPKFAPANGSSACGGSAIEVHRRRRPTPARRRCWPTRTSCRRSGRRRNSRKPRTGSTRPARRPLSLASLRGRVVLVDFWTYTCINCIRTLPYLKAWDADLPPATA